jgi:hypothetical protein
MCLNVPEEHTGFTLMVYAHKTARRYCADDKTQDIFVAVKISNLSIFRLFYVEITLQEISLR